MTADVIALRLWDEAGYIGTAATCRIHPPNGEPAAMWLELTHITRKVRTA